MVWVAGKDLAESGGLVVDGDFPDGDLVDEDVAGGDVVSSDAVDGLIQIAGGRGKKEQFKCFGQGS